MKKITFILLMPLISIAVNAQLKNTKWKGTIHSDSDIDVVFDYRSDTVDVINVADGSNLETTLYTVKDSVLTFKKVYGQSNCDASGTGTYKFEIKDNLLYITIISDACEDRSSAMNNSKWEKLK